MKRAGNRGTRTKKAANLQMIRGAGKMNLTPGATVAGRRNPLDTLPNRAGAAVKSRPRHEIVTDLTRPVAAAELHSRGDRRRRHKQRWRDQQPILTRYWEQEIRRWKEGEGERIDYRKRGGARGSERRSSHAARGGTAGGARKRAQQPTHGSIPQAPPARRRRRSRDQLAPPQT